MSPVMLALSTFRQSDEAVNLAIKKAKEGRSLTVVYVVDINIERYLMGSKIGFWPGLKERCKAEILKEYEEQARKHVALIVEMAKRYGIDVKTYVRTGRFAFECLEVVRTETPELIVTTRSKRPKWVKRLFGSPVDYLIANAKCPVVEA